MDHADHVRLIRDGVAGAGGRWADLGSGTGAFTLALAELLGPAGEIWSVDRDPGALRRQADALRAHAPSAVVHQLAGDFTLPLALPPMDGIVMANSLHFVRDKAAVLRRVRGWLREGGRLVLVEYDADRGNVYVPYPLSYESWLEVARAAGFRDTRRLGRVATRFLGAIYSAVCVSDGVAASAAVPA